MNEKSFNNYAKFILDQAKGVRDIKKTEYAAEKDRLSNFRKAAAIQGVSVPIAIRGMMVKHTVSIYDLIEGEFGSDSSLRNSYDLTLWEEKIVDQINYLLLLYSAVVESKVYNSEGKKNAKSS